MNVHWSKERQVAIDAVRAAAKVCTDVQGHLIDAQTIEKKDRSPVTIADFASQAVVCGILGAALPHDAIIGEEQADVLRQDGQDAVRLAVVERAGVGLNRTDLMETEVLDLIDRGAKSEAHGSRYWTLDPIDGTKGFLRQEQYAVALALLEDNEVVLGVLGCPNLSLGGMPEGALMVAVKGQGTKLMPLGGSGQDRTVAVSSLGGPSEARFCESVESAHSSHGTAAQIAEILGITRQPVRMDSQAKYASVAHGDSQIYMRLPTRADYRECIWDHAAGALVVVEAGGRSLDFSRDGAWNQTRVLWRPMVRCMKQSLMLSDKRSIPSSRLQKN